MKDGGKSSEGLQIRQTACRWAHWPVKHVVAVEYRRKVSDHYRRLSLSLLFAYCHRRSVREAFMYVLKSVWRFSIQVIGTIHSIMSQNVASAFLCLSFLFFWILIMLRNL